MAAFWHRPVNVDLVCKLRVIGQSKPSFTFESDEGDGYDVFAGYPKGEQYAPILKPYHFDEWIGQLENLIDWLNKEKARIIADTDKPIEADKGDMNE